MERTFVVIEQPTVSVQYLKSKGFALYVPGQIEDDFELIPGNFDVEFSRNDLVYLQKKFHRQMFCVVLSDIVTLSASIVAYSVHVWVQVNAGCGFVQIPDGFEDMTIKRFERLYRAIRDEKL
jgi:hypothetical protein